jgi:hypothetical protein
MEKSGAIAEIAFLEISVEIAVEIGEICGNKVENSALRSSLLRRLQISALSFVRLQR